MRKYEAWVCPDCGEQSPPDGHYHKPPEGWWTDAGPGPENVNGEDPWFDAVSVTAIDARDVEPLLDALRYIEGQDVAGMDAHQRAPDVAAAALGAFEEEGTDG